MSLREGLPVAALVYLVAVTLAYVCLKLYDEPVRKKVFVIFLWNMNIFVCIQIACACKQCLSDKSSDF